MTSSTDQTNLWDLWYPKAASTGLPFARGVVSATDRMLVHAAPPLLTVEVRDTQGNRIAFGQDLPETQSSPVCLLRRNGDSIEREDIWPGETELGLTVLLPGGEAGVLTSWWNAEDRKEWRWQIELYNSIR